MRLSTPPWYNSLRMAMTRAKDIVTREELIEIIKATEDAGRDASELKAALASMPQPAQSRKAGFRPGEEEELTTAEYLNKKVGDLFQNGVTDDVLAQLIKADYQYSLTELRVMCTEVGLRTSGDKKVLAAKLLANGNLRTK